MNYTLTEWLNLAFRWTHVFAAIMWVGQTFLFTWLDHTLSKEGQVWMVHSGGFYIVDKQKVPEMLPKTLHWFKWEAAITWLSGVSLFILLYYAGGLISAGNPLELTNMQAIGISLASIVVGWFIYDMLWISPLANRWNVAVVISYALLVGAIYGFAHIFSGRAAYLQTGALLGTFMAFNVWVRILPAQRALIAAVKAGQQPNMMLAERAKNRSTHNTFMVVPVVFMMLSNHFPVATYGHAQNWIILAGLVLVGWVVAHLIRSH
ncbi:MAG: hypothetical protein QOI24_2200 [Acidobacteriota bacterium]|nr:hypothetical protein [Acidobacteriota bacterium]